ncbi:MAG: penicillin-binding protein 1B, partial [Xanthomonas sp.]
VIWIGNDQNTQTGLYGAPGAMRGWSGLFSRLASTPLQVQGTGLDWQWMDPVGYNSTDPNCPGARQFPFVVGFVPAYAACTPPQALPEEAAPADGEHQGGGWRSWFGLDKKKDPPADAAAPPPAH